MIGRLRGLVVQRDPAGQVLLEVGGVGFELTVPLSLVFALPEPPALAQVVVHTAFSQEALRLFGFARELDRATFRALITVPGVGPRTAWQILSHVEVEQLREAVAADDRKLLSTIPGIGPKTAARLCLELAKKFAAEPSAAPPGGKAFPLESQAVAALVALGYKPAVAAKVVATVISKLEATATVQDVIRRALQLS